MQIPWDGIEIRLNKEMLRDCYFFRDSAGNVLECGRVNGLKLRTPGANMRTVAILEIGQDFYDTVLKLKPGNAS